MSVVEVMTSSVPPTTSASASSSSRRNSASSIASSSRKSLSKSRSPPPPPPSILLEGLNRRKSSIPESSRPSITLNSRKVQTGSDSQDAAVNVAAAALSRLRQQRRASLEVTAATRAPPASRLARNSVPNLPMPRGRQPSVSRPLPAARAAQLQLLAEQARLAAVGSSNLRTARAMSSAMTDAVRTAVNDEVTRRRTASMSAATLSDSRKRSFFMMALGDRASTSDDGIHDSAIMSDDDDDDQEDAGGPRRLSYTALRRPSNLEVRERSSSISSAAFAANAAHAAEWAAATTSQSFLQAAGEVAHDYASFYRFERQWADRALHYSMDYQPRRPSTVQEGSEEGRSESDGRSAGGSSRRDSLVDPRDTKRPRLATPLQHDLQPLKPVMESADRAEADSESMPPPPRGDSASPTCSPTSSPKPTRASLARRKSSSAANQDVEVLHMGPSSRSSVSSDWKQPLSSRFGALRTGSISTASGHGSFSSGGHGSFSSGHSSSFSSRGGTSISSVSSGGHRKSSFGLERVLCDFASLLAGREEVCTGLEQLARQARELGEQTAQASSSWTSFHDSEVTAAAEADVQEPDAVLHANVVHRTPTAARSDLPTSKDDNETSPKDQQQQQHPEPHPDAGRQEIEHDELEAS